MTIDERLEALTHSVELLAELHKDSEQRMQRLDRYIKRLGKYIHGVGALVLDHEARLRFLEGDEEDGEEL